MQRAARAVFLSAMSLCAAGCLREPPRVSLDLALAHASDAQCDLGALRALRVQALGDFAESDRTIELVDLVRMPAAATLSRFPFETRIVSVRGTAERGELAGLALVPEAARPGGAGPMPLLLLPRARSCLLPDLEARFPTGATATALADGLLVVGGAESGEVLRRTWFLRAGDELGERLALELGLKRTEATATRVGDIVLVAGGGSGPTGPAIDTYEVFDPALPGFDRARGGVLGAQRRQHGAGALPDGRVLLVGGRAESGAAPLASAELVQPGARGAPVTVGGLGEALVEPSVVTLDDGRVLVLGGRTESGRAGSRVYLLVDDGTPALQRVSGADVARLGAQAFALPGARVALVGGDAPSRSIDVLRFDPSPALDTLDDLFPVALTATRAGLLADGTLLVTGADPAGARRTFVVDCGTARASERPGRAGDPLPLALVVLADGSIAELGATRGALRRETDATPYDSPPTLLQGDTDGVALDAPGGFVMERGALRALRPARLDVPGLRFARFTMSLDVDLAGAAPGAAVELLFTVPGGAPVRLAFDAEGNVSGTCSAARLGAGPLRVERDGDVLRVSAGGAPFRCEPRGLLPDHVGLALRVPTGAVLRALRIERRAD